MPFRKSTRTSLMVLFAAAVAACGGGGDSGTVNTLAPTLPASSALGGLATGNTVPVQATEYIVSVQATDASIDTSFGSHYAYINASVSPKGKLFVFFPATDSKPQNYTLIETAAANAGFHSIGLAYPNGPDPVNLACLTSTDPDCTGKIREETFSGADMTSLVSVNAANSVQNRLSKALLYLHAQHPADGWNQFLDASNGVRWDRTRVSGLSQGGGLAGYIGKQKASVDRVCFFSSPADWDSLNARPSGWVLSATAATPASRIYGLNSSKDPIVPYQHIQQTWQAFGLDSFGAPVNVDTTQNYNGTHELRTDLGNSMTAHTLTASDGQTPLDASGNPIFLDVWKYACFN